MQTNARSKTELACHENPPESPGCAKPLFLQVDEVCFFFFFTGKRLAERRKNPNPTQSLQVL